MALKNFMTSDLKIIEYSYLYKDAFKVINVEWLEDMFVVEDYDNQVLSDPKKYILDRKGNIWMALENGVPLGTVALMELEDGKFELTKMAVTKTARGKGIGRKLLKHLINEVFNTELNTYFLLTNKNCKAAIHLYIEFNFKHDQEILTKYGPYYKRCNVGMIYTP